VPEADTLGHPAYDCTYLALAQAMNCELVTADETFVRKVRASGIEIPLRPLSELTAG